LLYQLSYFPIVAGKAGLEPTTYGFQCIKSDAADSLKLLTYFQKIKRHQYVTMKLRDGVYTN
jgi:hypothetical protein